MDVSIDDLYNAQGILLEGHPEPLDAVIQLVRDAFKDAILRKRAIDAHHALVEVEFPYLAKYNPGIVSYTATRWRYLIRRPRNWPKDAPIPTAGMCYRFVLSNPHVHVCMTAPSNVNQAEENLEALNQGPLSEEEMEFMRKFGDAVHHTKRWFM